MKTAIEALGVQPLAADLAKITALKDHSEVTTLLAQLQQDGISTPLSWYVNNDAKNSKLEYAVYLGQSGLGLPDRDYYFKDDEKSDAIRAAYAELYQRYADAWLALLMLKKRQTGCWRWKQVSPTNTWLRC